MYCTVYQKVALIDSELGKPQSKINYKKCMYCTGTVGQTY